jgi:hypothetical protein
MLVVRYAPLGALADDQMAADAVALDLQPVGVAAWRPAAPSCSAAALLDRGEVRGDAPADVPERLRGPVEAVDLDA